MTAYLVCYDIADSGRLRRAAKILQGQALRVQKSVYLLVGSPAVMNRCWRQLEACISPRHDDLRCYTIPEHSPLLSLGAKVVHDGLLWSGWLEE